MFLELCSKTTPEEISTCLYAIGWTPAEEPVPNNLLLDHIAEHIHCFALRPLPWAPDENEENGATSTGVFTKVTGWLTNCDPDEESCDYESILPSSHGTVTAQVVPPVQVVRALNAYFYTHEYFAESLKASSHAPTLSRIEDKSEDYDAHESKMLSASDSVVNGDHWNPEQDDGKHRHKLRSEQPMPNPTIGLTEADGAPPNVNQTQQKAFPPLHLSGGEASQTGKGFDELPNSEQSPKQRLAEAAEQLIPASHIHYDVLEAMLKANFGAGEFSLDVRPVHFRTE